MLRRRPRLPQDEPRGGRSGLAPGLDRCRGARPRGADPNPDSLVALASAGGLDVLLTADAESGALAPVATAAVDVLKVSHHGSEDPGLAALLGRLRPRVALISAGEGNPFRHPRPETLAALAAHAARPRVAPQGVDHRAADPALGLSAGRASPASDG